MCVLCPFDWEMKRPLSREGRGNGEMRDRESGQGDGEGVGRSFGE